VEVELDTDADDEVLARLAEMTDRYCVVAHSLAQRPTLTIRRAPATRARRLGRWRARKEPAGQPHLYLFPPTQLTVRPRPTQKCGTMEAGAGWRGLRVVPLGGIGEIGRNMTVFEHAGRLLVVDCGVLFPEEHQPGVDVILPDFTWIRDRLDLIEAIVLTHGHEDHIGGVPYLLRERRTSRWSARSSPWPSSRPSSRSTGSPPRPSRSARAAAEVRAVRLRVHRGQPLDPRRLAVAIRTAAGLVLHTGDFKMDQFPLDGGSPTCGRSRGSARRASTCSWSTPPTPRCPGSSPPSASSPRPSRRCSAPAPRRVIVSSFASHVHRIQQVLDAAHEPRPQGRLRRPLDGPQHGHRPRPGLPQHPQGAGGRPQGADNLPDNKITLICTGSQGEPMAALSRMANRDHPIRIGPGDTVLLASSLIPGNENAIYR
jgi:ribonuclease J